MQLPKKLCAGQQFKPTVVTRVNQIIDYLKTQRLVSDNKSIRINQLTSGIALSAVVNPPGSNGGASSQFDHPFKMTIDTLSEQGQEDQKVLHIKTGYLQMNGDDESRIAISFEQQNETFKSLPLPDEAGQYIVTLFVWYDPRNEDSQLGWVTRVLYLSQDVQVDEIVTSCGYFSIMLGNILVQQNEDNELTYTITKQLVNGDFAVFDGGIKNPFKAVLAMETYPDDGDVLDQPLMPFYVKVNPAKVYLNGEPIQVPYTWFQLGQNPFQKYYILKINTIAKLVELTSVALESYVYTEDQITYNIPICRLLLGVNSMIGVIQYLDNDFCFSIDDKKVYLNSDDEIPQYLEDKYKIPTQDYDSLDATQQSFYDAFNDNSLIKAVRYSSSSAFSDSSLSSDSSVVELSYYWDQLYWDYKHIPNWNGDSSSSSNLQTLYNQSNSLKWFDYGKIRVNQSDANPEYLNYKVDNKQWIFKKVSDDNNKLKIWTKKMVKGEYIKLTESNQNNDEEKPKVTIDWDYKSISGYSSSSSNNNIQTICNNAGNLTWYDYGKVRVNANDSSPNYLESKIENGQQIYKAVKNDSTLKIWTRKITAGYNTTLKQQNEGGDSEKPISEVRTHKTLVNVSSGIKKTETKTNENFTITYLIEVDYPNFALSVDSSIASLLSLEKTAGGIKIKSALQGSGLLAVSNGNISVLPAGSGNVVLACSNGTFTWLPYADCDLACQSSSSNSNSASSVGV